MGNTKRGQISFEALGGTHTLAFTMNAMCRYQNASGQSINKGAEALQADPTDMLLARQLFWAGLTGDYSEEEAGDIVSDIGFTDAFAYLAQAFEAAYPDADKSAGNGKAAKPQKKS